MAYLTRPVPTEDYPTLAFMTNNARPVCDCPERCTCYAEGFVASKDSVTRCDAVSCLPQDSRALNCGDSIGRALSSARFTASPASRSADMGGRPRKPWLRDGQRRTMAERADPIPEGPW